MRCPGCGAAVGAGLCPRCGGKPRRPAAEVVGPSPRLAVGWAAAGVGARLGSFSIDALSVVVIAGVVVALTRSVALACVVAVESVVALMVWEARTGLTVGNGLLRLRTSCQDRPWSPGAARELVRAGVVGGGALVGAAGAWVVVASGGQDRTGRGRTWADRAAGTVVVRVGETEPAQGAGPSPVVPHAVQPRASSVPALPGASSPRQRRLRVGSSPVPPAVPPVPPPAPPSATASLLQPDVTVLLVFDSGQRDQVLFGQAAVIGREPRPQEVGDRLVVVDDNTVSKDHLRVEHTADGVWLSDLGSTNGTRLVVDGEPTPLAPRVRTRIDGVVRVQVGQAMVMVSYLVKGGRP